MRNYNLPRELIKRVFVEKERIVLQIAGEDAAVLISIQDLELLEKLEKSNSNNA